LRPLIKVSGPFSSLTTAPASTYGAVGSLLLLLWAPCLSPILLFGAAFARAGLHAHGLLAWPRPTAVRVHQEILAERDSGACMTRPGRPARDSCLPFS